MAKTAPKQFDPNDGKTAAGFAPGLVLPVHAQIPPEELAESTGPFDGEAYIKAFTDMEVSARGDKESKIEIALSQGPIAKAESGPKPPPVAVDTGKLLFSAIAQASGVLGWPGFQPNTLRTIVRTNVAPQMIINLRCGDVVRYSDLSKQKWKPGWRIEKMDTKRAADAAEKQQIMEAESFLLNSCTQLKLDEATERDDKHYTSFQNFLDMAVRDTLTYAAMALWKDVDNTGKVKSFALLPAGNVRYTGRKLPDGRFVLGGYEDKPEIATCLVNDDGTNAVEFFTREQLTFFIRNPRTDADIYGYGYPEIEQAFRVIQGFQNALEMNTDAFNRSAIPNGILVLTGGQATPKQLDLLNRVWTNMKKGVSKSWALPVIGLNEGGKVEILDLSRMKGNEGYYKEFMNMLAGMLCALWKFPIDRLGYKASGEAADNVPAPDAQVNSTDAEDPGLSPLLSHIEALINQYLIWTRWPHLRFSFTGKSPKEDAREYEARRNAMTYGEARIEADLLPVSKMAGSLPEELKVLAQAMDLAPIDPNLAGIYQTALAAVIKTMFEVKEEPATPGSEMTSKKDPARSESKGATSGVRRDSRAETAATKTPKKT